MNGYSLRQNRKGFLSSLGLTTQLIIVNIFFFIVFSILIAFNGEFIKYIALQPSAIANGQNLWTILTSIFMHAGIFHLFFNMFSLFFVGRFLEKLIGKKRFFWVYIISGLIGSLFFVLGGLIFGGPNVAGVGASGAIFGILGVLAVLVPFSRIYLMAGPLILIILDVLLANFLPANVMAIVDVLINLLIIVMIFSILSFSSRLRKFAVPLELPMWSLPIVAIVPLVVIGFFIPLPIGNSAHIGGLVAGLIYGFYLTRKYKNKTKLMRNHFR